MLGVVVAAGAYAVLRALAARGVTPAVRQSAVTAGSLLEIPVGFALLPDIFDPVEAPAALVDDFRVRSLGLLALPYATLDATFGVLTLRQEAAPTGLDASRLPV